MKYWRIKFRTKGETGRWRLACTLNDANEAANRFDNYKEHNGWADYELTQVTETEIVVAR